MSQPRRDLRAAFEYVDANAERSIELLRRQVRIPSVTSDKDACATCAADLAAICEEAGLQVRVDAEEATAPVLYVGSERATGEPVVIGYGHYDVKPAGPLHEWTYGPWAATIDGGRMYGRGVVDNKSGCLALVLAAQACLETIGMPVDFRLVLEGEEEDGSPHLEDWALAHADDVKDAEGLFCMDGSVDASTNLPRIDLFGRGILYVEISVQTAEHDVHSSRSMLAHNAAWRLIDALTTIKDVRSDRVIIPGWADDLLPATADDDDYFRDREPHFQADAIHTQYGIRLPGFPGDRRGFELLKAHYMEPSCTICGMWSGHIEPGVKMTSVPKQATAKLDFRCPPNMHPEQQVVKLREHLDAQGFPDVRIEVLTARGHMWKTSHRSTIVQAIRQAGLEVFGHERYRPDDAPSQEGIFYQNFGVPPVLTGFANPDCHIHAPNENVVLEHYLKGIKYTIAIVHRFAELRS